MDNTVLDSTQFTMLGLTGSGKTCYLLGMYKKMAGGLNGFSLITDSDTDVKLRRRYKKMQDPSLGQARFPAGTDQPDSYNFILSHCLAPIMSFEWIDYPGGSLEEQTTGDIEAFKKLEKHIQNSSSLFICVDGKLINGDNDDDRAESIIENCSDTINQFIQRYILDNDFLPPIAIIITKFDECPKDIKWEVILRKAFSPLLASGNCRCSRFVCCIPVSLGTEISSNGYKGKLKPKNIELPIFMGIYFSIKCKIAELDKSNKLNNQKINSLQTETQKENNKWFPNWDIIATNNANERELRNLSQRIQKQYEYAEADANRLLEELNAKIGGDVFFNGEKRENFQVAAKDYLARELTGHKK